MNVKRITTNIATHDVASAKAFYGDLLGLDVLMDLGWIATYGAPDRSGPQISVASDGGSGAAVPDISIEVDDLEAALRRTREAGLPIEYGPTDEPWGVRRFFLRDPFGTLVNIVAHR